MTAFPYAVDVDAPVHEAQVLMEEHGIRHLPVTEHGRLVGVLTHRDVQQALDPLLGIPPMIAVNRIMVREPYVVAPEEPLDAVLETLATRRIGCAIVARGGELYGIFTATDACRLWAVELRARRPLT